MPREGQTTEPMWLESRKALSKWRVHINFSMLNRSGSERKSVDLKSGPVIEEDRDLPPIVISE
jgi:hypothetical protein